jgi:monomeric isocitrate dehydrogenase
VLRFQPPEQIDLISFAVLALILSLTPGACSCALQVNQLDNRASNFYIALYWADFMAQADPAYKVRVTPHSFDSV